MVSFGHPKKDVKSKRRRVHEPGHGPSTATKPLRSRSGRDGKEVDGSKTLHAAGVFKPEVKTPFLDKAHEFMISSMRRDFMRRHEGQRGGG